MGLPCVNCKKDVSAEEAKMFAETFVCPDCFRIAKRFMQRGVHEAQQMLVILKEAIRIGLVRGELQFTSETIEDMKPAELFEEMSKLAETARAAQKKETWPTKPPTPTTTPSKVSTSPSAAGQDADGKQRSN